MRKSAANNDVLSTRDAAEQLGVALRTVQLWVEHGVLPAWKTAGGHRRISRVAVEKLLSERSAALLGAFVPQAMPQPPSAAPRLKLLVVEDDPDELHLMCLVIQSWGLPIEIVTATNGFEALLRIGESCPDLLLTDLSMPGMDGFRMIGSLQLVGRIYDRMKIIVVTAMSPEEIEQRGALPAHVQVFAKPVSFSSLQGVMRDQLVRLAAPAAPG
jgi:excisionase family DNA binding protein